MSIATMTKDFANTVAPDKTTTPTPPRSKGATDTVPKGADEGEGGESLSTFEALTEYIPAETLTLYLGASTSIAALTSLSPILTEATVYWAFLVLTPVLVFVMNLVARREQGFPVFGKYDDLQNWKQRFGEAMRVFPAFKVIASIIAFAIWALAVPSNPFLQGEEAAVVASFGALTASTLLKVFEPLFEPGKRKIAYL